mmetsp:Transcript_90522/g.279931  ORF Transcript_90522/g.279931 Transcript_90522/m.279931 type:complete len:250 (+) Transcript_90522:181-930(+)
MQPRHAALGAALGLALAVGSAGLPRASARRPATDATAGRAVQASGYEVPEIEGRPEMREAYSERLRSLVSAVHQAIESKLNFSYSTALQEEQRYRRVFSHLREGLDNFTRNTRRLQAQIPADRMAELRAIKAAFSGNTVPKVMRSHEVSHSTSRSDAESALQHGTGVATGADRPQQVGPRRPAAGPAASTGEAEVGPGGGAWPVAAVPVPAPQPPERLEAAVPMAPAADEAATDQAGGESLQDLEALGV